MENPACFGVLYPYKIPVAELEKAAQVEFCFCLACPFRTECAQEKDRRGPVDLTTLRTWLATHAPGIRNTVNLCPPINEARVFLTRDLGTETVTYSNVSARARTKMVLSSLTSTDKDEIRQLYSDGTPTTALASKYGVPAYHMRDLLKSLGCKLRRGRVAGTSSEPSEPSEPAKPSEPVKRARRVKSVSTVTAAHGKEIESLYRAGKGVVAIYKDYGRALGYQPTTISAHLKAKGFEIKRGRKKISEE